MQMADPLTALMYAVQVMNFLKTLIVKTLRDREESIAESTHASCLEPSNEDGHQSSSRLCVEEANEEDKGDEERVFVAEGLALDSASHPTITDPVAENLPTITEMVTPGGNQSLVDNCPCEVVSQVTGPSGRVRRNASKSKTGQSSFSSFKKGSKKVNEGLTSLVAGPAEKAKGPGIVGRINSRTELFEAWR